MNNNNTEIAIVEKQEVDLSYETVLAFLKETKPNVADCTRALLLARDIDGNGYDYGAILRGIRVVHENAGSLKTIPWYASKMRKSGIELPKRPRLRRPKNRALCA